MDKKKQKKMIAAISAVSAYIKSQEEMGALQATAMPQEPAPAATVGPPPSLWGVSGRLDQMQLRNLMQMKALHGVRFR